MHISHCSCFKTIRNCGLQGFDNGHGESAVSEPGYIRIPLILLLLGPKYRTRWSSEMSHGGEKLRRAAGGWGWLPYVCEPFLPPGSCNNIGYNSHILIFSGQLPSCNSPCNITHEHGLRVSIMSTCLGTPGLVVLSLSELSYLFLSDRSRDPRIRWRGSGKGWRGGGGEIRAQKYWSNG